MSEADNIEKVCQALEKVPEKRLLIIDLVRQIPIVNGELDYQTVTNRRVDVKAAIDEVKAYGAHTLNAVNALVTLTEKDDHVGP